MPQLKPSAIHYDSTMGGNGYTDTPPSEIKKHREPPPGADESNDFRSEGGCQAGEQPESCTLDRGTETGQLVILVGEVLHTSV